MRSSAAPTTPSPRRLLLGAAFALLVLAVRPPAGRAEDHDDEGPRTVPVAVSAKVDATDAAALGRWRVTLTFLPSEDVHPAYGLYLRLEDVGREVLSLDHAPEPPTTTWRKGRAVTETIDVPVPLDEAVAPGTTLDLRLAFVDPATGDLVPPAGGEGLGVGRFLAAQLVVPPQAEADGPAAVERVLLGAAERVKSGDRSGAWRLLVRAIRRASEDETKRRFRDALLQAGPLPAPPPSLIEDDVVRERIAEEKRRYLRQMSGRYFDQGHLFAALRLLEAVGGTLEEDADRAVIGALAEAKRTEKDIQDLRVRILARVTDEDRAAAEQAIDALGTSRKLLEKGVAWLQAKAYARARIVLRSIATSGDHDLAAAARAKLDETEAAWLADTPPDEQQMVDDAVGNPAFNRLAVVPSQSFLFIGPQTLVESIPEVSRLRYDLAYVFLTDLFGRLPNPAGDRVTVFFKELWDFGGGQGGGKRIDIGRADPHVRGTRVDTGLLYHELTHCIDDTAPIYHGFREGLANFGAAYAFEALGQKADEIHAFQSNLEAFEKDYVGRDIPYWRIQDYGPSAGFFLWFEEKYAKTATGHDWKPYRRFFRAYRAMPVKDGREPDVVRALAYHLVRAFGPGAFDDLVRFRFPLVETDRDILATEVEGFARGEWSILQQAERLLAHPSSPLRRDLVERALLGLARRSDDPAEVRKFAEEELGIVHDWWVIGPFRSPRADPRVVVFAPEQTIDLKAEYVSGNNACQWRKAGEAPAVTVDPIGWVGIHYAYQDDTATYALTHVTVDHAEDAFVHVRADDDVTVFLNGERVESYAPLGPSPSSLVPWRGPAALAPDAMRFPVHLREGRNRVLVKVKNRWGDAGFVLAICGRDGAPIAGLHADLLPADPEPASKPPTWHARLRHDFRVKAFGPKLEVTVGSFQVQNQHLRGQATDQKVPWRKYTVRPGFPRDAPSNLAWLKEKATAKEPDFRLSLDLVPKSGGVPKIVVAFQAEGGTDVLAGWALILHPTGKDEVQARLERHEDLQYQTVPVKLSDAESRKLRLELLGDRLTVSLGEVVLFDHVWIARVPDRHRIGFATFGPDLAIASFELESP